MMVGEDQFSFPILSNPMSHLMQASSLWRITSRVYHSEDFDEEGRGRCGNVVGNHSKSMEGTEGDGKYGSCADEEGRERDRAEKRMDLLWEQFNDEEQRNYTAGSTVGGGVEDEESAPSNNKKKRGKKLAAAVRVGSASNVAAKDTSKGGAAVVRRLKKIFSLRLTRQKVHGMPN